MLLALDCSQNYGSLALLEAGVLIYSAYFDLRVTHSETLLPALDHALKLLGKKPAELEAILLSNGPGSFTGLRIGLATAKGLALGLQIPIYPYDSLQMMAVAALGMNSSILVAVDAK
ncbi:MAG TPA: tRNA (adenosine(37)-N6)-threonylcarbamoyltransferase complex dimerization subunit type 1 TsaB, partial [Candidatus Cloacimonadota bacterium]|nr:tRNA (adenosine(37)-N6)-threonylcarbamoyltransferase complex dimerization subunit type 1 TsaB [Candidatus Cloacimonadota bacterium]